MHDIGTFMYWWIGSCVDIFQWTYETLNDITFMGTSLLKVIIFINIIVPFLYIIITIPIGAGNIGGEAVLESRDKIKKHNRIVRSSNTLKSLHPEWQTDSLE